MKKIIILSILSISISFADKPQQNTEKTYCNTLTKAVEEVEKARNEALDALDNMVKKVDIVRESNPQNENSTCTKIVETHALSQMAKSTADVEIAKTKAIAVISKAIDNIDNANEENSKKVKEKSFKTIIHAIASVELAKANASKNIVEATQRVEISKADPEKEIEYEEETLSIAKNIAAVQIAKSVSDVEVARSNSLIEIARSSMKNMKSPLSKEDEEKLKKIKAEATAKISSYLAILEVLKAELTTKIANEIVNVELAESKMMTSSNK